MSKKKIKKESQSDFLEEVKSEDLYAKEDGVSDVKSSIMAFSNESMKLFGIPPFKFDLVMKYSDLGENDEISLNEANEYIENYYNHPVK